ncbi:MAG: UPF0146 family protein [Halobacteriales archaeon]|nr:UPF0146 family protein [Halobacteriales archaeon]
MDAATRDALAARLRPFDPVVELAIGRRPAVAAALAETNAVIATDLVDRPVPPGVHFVRDDLTAPDELLYNSAAALYALNLPEELHRPALDLAEAVDAALAFTTLGNESPTVPVGRRETLPGETLFWVRERADSG